MTIDGNMRLGYVEPHDLVLKYYCRVSFMIGGICFVGLIAARCQIMIEH